MRKGFQPRRIYFFAANRRLGGEELAGKYKFLTIQDRKKVAIWYLNGDRPCDIAARLGVHTATVYNELQRGHTGAVDINQRPAYDPMLAQEAVQMSFKRRGRKRAEPARVAEGSRF